ncbi:transporter substrate-binding domain-containing diguanylate cyclase [Thalassotalea atypica]|uniref:transporter substrate-binding domain-containing diguanylate cyclase n=1 Tax=Thalassotalea atypica TaxID=2054316 RepID=UPI002573FFDB|nr:GGDEF domain-containing protein [Thalassotalea atypica]
MIKRLFWLPLLLIFCKAVQADNNFTYCVDPSWAPYESIESGQHVGISSHYLALISQYSGLNFTLFPTKSWQESMTAFKQGQCKVIPMLNQSEQREKTMAFSQEYFNASNVLYTNTATNKLLLAGFSSLTNDRVAVVQGYRLHDFLESQYPNLTIIPVLNEEMGLKQLSEHNVEFFVGSFYSSNRLIQKLTLTNIKIAGISELQDRLKIGVSHDIKHILPQINSAIAQLSARDHRHVFNQIQRTEVVARTDYTLVWKVTGVALLILLIIIIKHYESLKQRKILSVKNSALERLRAALEHKNEQLAELTIKDHLTDLYNRLHLNEHIEANMRLKERYNSPCCLILIDIDDFKKFNDEHGHKVGDDILKQVAQVLKEVSRNTDICARWGGEEFAILCPETELEAALALASRFQDKLATLRSPNHKQVTCSIGISEIASGENESKWFTNTDEALYQAKAKGKNCIHINT